MGAPQKRSLSPHEKDALEEIKDSREFFERELAALDKKIAKLNDAGDPHKHQKAILKQVHHLKA